MFLRYHGAHCCGVKTLEGFFEPPGVTLGSTNLPINPREALHQAWPRWNLSNPSVQFNLDQYGYEVSSKDSFYNLARPRETAEERLDVYLDYLKQCRPKGMVDAYLTQDQRKRWHDTLRKKGFKVACEFINSNTGNTVTCYQLCYGQPKKVSTKKKVSGLAPFIASSVS